MSKAKKADDDVTEIVEIDASRIDGVGQAATGLPFLLIKARAPEPKTKFGRNAGRRLSPAARAAFEANTAAIRQGRKPKKGKTKRRRAAGPAASKAASGMSYSQEIPATNCPNESTSILAAVTGERSNGMCSARTMSGLPCQRPSVAGGRCHHHA